MLLLVLLLSLIIMILDSGATWHAEGRVHLGLKSPFTLRLPKPCWILNRKGFRCLWWYVCARVERTIHLDSHWIVKDFVAYDDMFVRGWYYIYIYIYVYTHNIHTLHIILLYVYIYIYIYIYIHTCMCVYVERTIHLDSLDAWARKSLLTLGGATIIY